MTTTRATEQNAANIAAALMQVATVLDTLGQMPTPSVMRIRNCAADVRDLARMVAQLAGNGEDGTSTVQGGPQ